MTNNSGKTCTGLEHGTSYQCSVVSHYGAAEAIRCSFKVTLGGSGGSNWSVFYKNQTFTGSNKVAMFFYSGKEFPDANEQGTYGSPV